MNKLYAIVVSSFFILPSALAQTAVLFPLVQMTGTTNDTTLTIKPVNNPIHFNHQIIWLPTAGVQLQTTNGSATTNLIPNDYTVTIKGVPGSWRISVNDTNVTLNAADIGNLTTYTFTSPLPGVLQLIAGANITLNPPNGIGPVVINSSGGGGGGSDTAANIGTGAAIFAQKSGAQFQFRAISNHVGSASVSNNATTVFIEADPAGSAASATNFVAAWLAGSNAAVQANIAVKANTNSPTIWTPSIFGKSDFNLNLITNFSSLSSTRSDVTGINVGFDAEIHAQYAIAIGDDAIIGGNGLNGSAFGNSVLSDGFAAHAVGDSVNSRGDYAMGFGQSLDINGEHSFGWNGDPDNGLTVSGTSQFVVQDTNGFHFLGSPIYGNGNGLTNLSPTAATNNAVASDGWALTKSGGNLKLVAFTGSGTVTSVGLSTPSEFTPSGSPVTGAGTLSFARTADANLLGFSSTNGNRAAFTNTLTVGGAVPFIDPTNVFQVNTLHGAKSFQVNSNGQMIGDGAGVSNIPPANVNGLIPWSAMGANQYVGTDANTNPAPTQNGINWTNMDAHYTNYGAVTNITLPADGNKWICLVTNGPHNWLNFGGNNMGAVSVWITTNGDVQWPPQFSFLGYSNHLTTNCIIDFQPWGGTNRGVGGQTEF